MATDLLIVDTVASGADSPAGISGRDPRRVDGAGQGGRGVEAVGNDNEGTGKATAGQRDSTRPFSAMVSDFVQLTKPRIVVMILVTTVATATIAAGGWVSLSDWIWLMLGTAAVAASAGAANQIWERTIDRAMTRTASRPLPDGRLRLWPSILFTAVLGLLGSLLLAVMFGPIPATAGVVTWLLYVLVYTPMKIRTAWNTTVGAIAGALPVLIGYTALGGGLQTATAWLLVGVLVAWQYPHFMAIAWIYRRQYADAGFQMTTTVEPTGRSAALQSILGSVGLMAFGVALCLIPSGWVAGSIASLAVVASAAPMLRASFRFAGSPSDATARKLLRSSLLVLPAVLLIVTLRVFW